jgi:hypothetical protein
MAVSCSLEHRDVDTPEGSESLGMAVPEEADSESESNSEVTAENESNSEPNEESTEEFQRLALNLQRRSIYLLEELEQFSQFLKESKKEGSVDFKGFENEVRNELARLKKVWVLYTLKQTFNAKILLVFSRRD